MQHAVDTEADHALLAPRLQVDVTGALVERVLPQPVHHLHNALVIGVELLVGLAQLDQLLKIGAAVVAGLVGRAHRLGQRVELGRVAVNLQRAGQHPAHGAARLAFHFGHPVGDKGFGRGHGELGRAHRHRQDAVPLGVHGAHGVGDLAHLHLERVDAQIVHATALGQPLRQ